MERTLKWTLCTVILAELVLSLPLPLYSQTAAGSNPELEKRIERFFSQLPPIRQHFENVTEAQALEKREEEQNHRKLSLERREGKWAAALLEEKTLAIQNRF